MEVNKLTFYPLDPVVGQLNTWFVWVLFEMATGSSTRKRLFEDEFENVSEMH